MEAADNPSRGGAPLLLASNDLGHGSAADAFLLHLASRAAALPSGDLEQQSLDEERTTTVTCGRVDLDLAGDGDASHMFRRNSLPL